MCFQPQLLEELHILSEDWITELLTFPLGSHQICVVYLATYIHCLEERERL